MTETKFTPGPWLHDDVDDACQVVPVLAERRNGCGGRETICDCGFDHEDERESFEDDGWAFRGEAEAVANARLIAAAPDLYAALEAILAKIDADNAAMVAQVHPSWGPVTVAPHPATTLARAALAKAVKP